MTEVSIIIPVYNAEKYIRKCLDSVITQTLRNIEIICINDASIDNSLEILMEYSVKDTRLKIINNEKNIGVTKSRNIGLNNSLGEYIFFIDIDDWIEINYIESLYKLAYEYKTDAVFGAMTLIWKDRMEERPNNIKEGLYVGVEKLKSLQYFYDVEKKRQLIKWSIWGNLYKKDRFYKHQIKVDERIKVGEDLAVFIPFILDSVSIYITNVTSYYYRQHEESTMHSKKTKAMDYYYLWDYLKQYIEKRPDIKHQVAHICCAGIENDYVNLMNLKKQNFYMFPYEIIPAQSSIVIFGSGLVGQSYYRQLKINQYCELKYIIDNNYDKNADEKYLVVSPDNIIGDTYDYILIAVMSEEISKKICNQLISVYSVPEQKIITSIPRMITDFIDLE